jgi:hypothetical protein
VPTVLKSGSLNLLEPSGLLQACNGIALPFSGPFEKSMMFTIIVSSFILGILFCCCYLSIIIIIIIINIIIIIIINSVCYNVGARACICSRSRQLSHRDHIQIDSGVCPLSHPVVIVGSLPGNKAAGP